MKAIEERAKKYGIESANLLCSDLSEEQRERQAEIYARVYSKIATEQKAIDIDKAKRAFCKANECVLYDKCQRVNGVCFAMQRFIQAMEE